MRATAPGGRAGMEEWRKPQSRNRRRTRTRRSEGVSRGEVVCGESRGGRTHTIPHNTHARVRSQRAAPGGVLLWPDEHGVAADAHDVVGLVARRGGAAPRREAVPDECVRSQGGHMGAGDCVGLGDEREHERAEPASVPHVGGLANEVQIQATRVPANAEPRDGGEGREEDILRVLCPALCEGAPFRARIVTR